MARNRAVEIWPGKPGSRKLSDDDVRRVRRLCLGEGWTYGQVQKAYYPNVARETIARAVRRETHFNVLDVVSSQEMEPDVEEALVRMRAEGQAILDAAHRGNAMLDELAGMSPEVRERARALGGLPPKSPLDEQGEGE
jgi:hypothetical protein